MDVSAKFMRTERSYINGDLYEEIPVNDYQAYVEFAGCSIPEPIPMRSVQVYRDILKSRSDVVTGVYVVNDRRVTGYPVCNWCGVRPCAIDHDTEGPYYTSKCASDQCKPKTLRKGRTRIEGY